jgi:hypothetical protein
MAEIQSWQKQNMSKNGAATGPSTLNAKITGNSTMLHGKIAKPTAYADGGMVRKYADGGMVQDDATGVDEAVARNAADDANRATATGEWARGENYGDGTTGQERVDMAKAPEMAAKSEDAAPRKQTFKEAFAENRKAGNATFEFEGKKFTTELAKPKAQAPRDEKKTEAPASVVRKAPAQTAKPMSLTDTGDYNDGAKLSLATGGSFGSKANTAARPIVQRGKGIIDTSNIDSKTLLPKR